MNKISLKGNYINLTRLLRKNGNLEFIFKKSLGECGQTGNMMMNPVALNNVVTISIILHGVEVVQQTLRARLGLILLPAFLSAKKKEIDPPGKGK